MKLVHGPKKILLSFLFTYVPIILLALLAVLTVFYQLSINLQQEINTQNYRDAVRIQAELDKALTLVRQRAYTLCRSSNVPAFSRKNLPLDAANIYKAYQLTRDVSMISGYPGFSSSTFLYFPNNRSVVTANGMVDSWIYYIKYAEKYSMSYQEWMDTISTLGENKFYCHNTIENGVDKSYIFYVSVLPKDATNPNPASAVVILSVDELIASVGANQVFENGNFRIVDSEGKTVYSKDKTAEFLPSSEDLDISLMPSIYERDTPNGKLGILSVKSSIQNWHYFIEIPTAVFYQNMGKAYLVLVVAIFAILVLGILLTLYFLVKNYAPVRRIHALIPEDQVSGEDEYERIEVTLVEMMNSNQLISDTLARQQTVLRQNLLMNLLLGNLHDETDSRKLRELKVDLENTDLCLLCISLLGASSNDELNNICEKLEEMSETISEIASRWYIVESFPMIFIVTALKTGGESNLSEELSTAVWSKIGGKHISCAVSSVKTKWKALHEAYNEVLVVQDIENCFEVNSGLYFYDKSHSKLQGKLEQVLSPTMQKRFCGLIRAKEYDEAKRFLTHFLHQTQLEAGSSLYMIKTFSFALMNAAINSMKSENGDAAVTLIGEIDLYEKLVCAGTFPVLESTLLSCIDLICELLSDNEKPDAASPHARQLVEKIQAYIEDNFKNAELNVSTVANNFEVNLSYLSKTFKDATGRNVLDFINGKRAECAKQLLSTTSLSIKEIAELSGFYNSNAFIRSLKKYEGVTPMQYRNGN